MGSIHDLPTFGIEEEFLLVDPTSFQAAAVNEKVAHAARSTGTDLQLELTQCQVETTSPVCQTARQVDAAVRLARKNAACAAEEQGVRLVAIGVSPMAAEPQPLTDKSRYHLIADKFGILANQVPVCGCHVHVELDNKDNFAGVCNHLRPLLPTFLALSANSPFCDGIDTGYASWRSILWGRWPTAGPPPYLENSAQMTQIVRELRFTGAMIDDHMMYWDVRPSSHLPTVEIRVCDVAATVDEAVLLGMLIRAAVVTAQERVADGDGGPPISDTTLRAASWRAARDGLSGELVDLTTMQTVTARQGVESLLQAARPALESAGEFDEARELLDLVLAHGNGAMRQRAAFARRGRVEDVVAESLRLTLT